METRLFLSFKPALASVIFLLLFFYNSSALKAAEIAFWDELIQLSRQIGAISHLDTICTQEKSQRGDWDGLFEKLASDSVLTEAQERFLKTLYLDSRYSYGDVYRKCTQNALALLLSETEKAAQAIESLQIKHSSVDSNIKNID